MCLLGRDSYHVLYVSPKDKILVSGKKYFDCWPNSQDHKSPKDKRGDIFCQHIELKMALIFSKEWSHRGNRIIQECFKLQITILYPE